MEHISQSKGKGYVVPDDDIVSSRFIDAANAYYTQSPLPRGVMYDFAFGKDLHEYSKLNGFGVILISVITQDPAELPLKKAYFLGKTNAPTQLIGIAHINRDIDSELVKKVFGETRIDYYFLIHSSSVFSEGVVLIDFNKNRAAFTVGKFPPGNALPYKVNAFGRNPDTENIDKAALNIFLKREFGVKLN